jgi:hypothetical protein
MANGRLRAVDWATLIDEWRQSGLSLPAFCERHGLSRGTMQNWVYKPSLKHAVEEARREAQARAAGTPPVATSPAFQPVRVAEAAPAHEPRDGTGVEIILPTGRRVVVGAGFDMETLRRVVALLEGRPC